MNKATAVLDALLCERRNRHAWWTPTLLLCIGTGLLFAGLGVDLWWMPPMLPLAMRPRRAK